MSGDQICYTTEALKYAQAAYLGCIVASQWACMLTSKVRTLSLAQQNMYNGTVNFSLFFETALLAFLLYVPPINVGLGTRPVACAHFMIPCFTYFLIIVFHDETRKVFLRRGIVKGAKGGIKLSGWMARNTYF